MKRGLIRKRATAVALVLLLAGCATTDQSIVLANQAVTPMTGTESAEVSAYDLAEGMLRAGLEPDQVIKYGPAIRNALATSGAAQVRIAGIAEAIFAIENGRLLITSRTRGTFVQPLRVIVTESGA